MSPRVDFPRRGKSNEKNGNMRCHFGQVDEERWQQNKKLAGCQMCLDFWKGKRKVQRLHNENVL